MLLALRRCGLRGKLKSGHGVVSVDRPFDGEVNAPQVWPNKIPLARYLQQNLMDPPCLGSGVPVFVLHFHFEKGLLDV